MGTKVLVVVDYQNDFVDGAIGFKEAVDIEHKIVSRLEQYKRNNGKIVFTFDTHGEDYINTQEGHRLPIKHTVKGTKGWEAYGLVGTFLKENRELVEVVEKNTFGALGLIDVLRNYDKQQSVESIEFCGVVTNMCVMSNAVIAKATLPEARIVINEDACSSFDMKLHYASIDVMESMQMDII